MKINLKNSLLLSLALISGTSQANYLSNNQKLAAAALFTAAVSLGIWLCRDDSRPSTNSVDNSSMPADQVVDKSIDIDGEQPKPLVKRRRINCPSLPLSPVVSRQSLPTPALLQADQVVDIDGSYQQQPVVNRVLTPVVSRQSSPTTIDRDFSPNNVNHGIYEDFTLNYSPQLFYNEQGVVNKIVIYNQDGDTLVEDSIIVSDNPLRNVKSVVIENYSNGVYYLNIDGEQIVVT